MEQAPDLDALDQEIVQCLTIRNSFQLVMYPNSTQVLHRTHVPTSIVKLADELNHALTALLLAVYP